MRLPWPFGRAQRSPSEGGDALSGGGAALPGHGPALSERATGDAWRRLPPLAETVGPPPLVAPNRPFAAALAANDPPAPILAPLSHGRSLEAPRGLVVGVAKPIVAPRGPELPRPVQRSPLHANRGTPADANWSDSLEPGVEAPPPAPVTRPVEAAPAAPGLPMRKLEVAAAVARPATKELTRAPDVGHAKPLGLVGQPRAIGAGIQRSPEPTPAPVQRAPMATAPATLPAAHTPEPDADRPRRSIGQTRRLGLGLPIAGGTIRPGAEPFSRPTDLAPGTAVSTSLPAPEPTLASIQRSPEPSPADMPLAARATHEPTAGAPEPVAQRAPAAPADGPGHQQAPVLARRIGAPPTLKSLAASPIVSAQPLKAGVQRAPLTLPSKGGEEAASVGNTVQLAPSTGAGDAPVKVHRDGAASQLSKSLDARSFTHGGEIYLPASHGPISSGKGRSLLAHELTHVTQQRKLGTNLPEEHTPHGKALEAEAVAAERSAHMPLAGPPAAPQQRSGSAPAKAAPDLSPAAPVHAGSATGPAATGPAQRAPANGDEGADGGGSRRAHSEQELEDLAKQLYGRIGRQLRRELLVDRERAGFAMDLR